MSGSISATTLAYVAVAAAVAGAAVGTYSSVQSANAQSDAAKFNSKIAENNAKIAEQKAQDAAHAGEVQAGQEAQKTRATVGAIQTAQAANNLDINSGSDVDVRSSAAELGELSAINIRSNATREAYGYQTTASSDKAQSQLDQFQAQQAQLAGETGAAGSILGGIGSASGTYNKYLSNSSITPGVIGGAAGDYYYNPRTG